MRRVPIHMSWSNRPGYISLIFWMTVLVSYLQRDTILLNYQDFLFSDGRTGCTISDVLVFFTGTNQIPPLGFGKTPTVSFLRHNDLFATASTCDVRLRLPIKYGDDLEAFKQAMIMSLKDNDGFGAL